MCGHILISSAWCTALGFAWNVIGIQPMLSLDAGWLKLFNFLFITAPPSFSKPVSPPLPSLCSPSSFPASPLLLVRPLSSLCTVSSLWAHRRVLGSNKCSSRRNNRHKLKLKWSILMVRLFFVIVSVHSYNIIPPNRLEFEVVYIFLEESTEFVFFLKRN